MRPEDSHPEAAATGERIESGGERNHVHPLYREGTMPVPKVPKGSPGPAVPVKRQGAVCNTTPNHPPNRQRAPTLLKHHSISAIGHL